MIFQNVGYRILFRKGFKTAQKNPSIDCTTSSIQAFVPERKLSFLMSELVVLLRHGPVDEEEIRHSEVRLD